MSAPVSTGAEPVTTGPDAVGLLEGGKADGVTIEIYSTRAPSYKRGPYASLADALEARRANPIYDGISIYNGVTAEHSLYNRTGERIFTYRAVWNEDGTRADGSDARKAVRS